MSNRFTDRFRFLQRGDVSLGGVGHFSGDPSGLPGGRLPHMGHSVHAGFRRPDISGTVNPSRPQLSAGGQWNIGASGSHLQLRELRFRVHVRSFWTRRIAVGEGGSISAPNGIALSGLSSVTGNLPTRWRFFHN